MILTPFLKPRLTFFYPRVDGTDQLYQWVARDLLEQGVVSRPDSIKRLFVRRESLHSTAIGGGVATPHIYSPEFREFVIPVARVAEPIPFEAPDESPVHLVFFIVSDDRDVPLHLKTLSRISRMTLDQSWYPQVLDAASPDDLVNLIIQRDKGLADTP